MKKFVAITLSTVMLLSSLTYAGDIGVTLNGEDIAFSNQEPLIVDSRTLVPLRGIFEKLGYSISWDGETKTATLTKDSSTIAVTANSDNFVVDGKASPADVPAQIINGSMMLPLRAIAELAGAEVNWDSETKTVSILTTLDKDTIDKNAEAIKNAEEDNKFTAEADEKAATRAKKEALSEDFVFEDFRKDIEYDNLCNAVIYMINLSDLTSIEDTLNNTELTLDDTHDNIEEYTLIRSAFVKQSAPEGKKELKDSITKLLDYLIAYNEAYSNHLQGRTNKEQFEEKYKPISEKLSTTCDKVNDALRDSQNERSSIDDTLITEDDLTDEEKAIALKYTEQVAKDFIDIYSGILSVDPSEYQSWSTLSVALGKQEANRRSAAEKGLKALEKLTQPDFCKDQTNVYRAGYEYFTKKADLERSFLENEYLSTTEYLLLTLTYSQTQIDIFTLFTGVDVYSKIDDIILK